MLNYTNSYLVVTKTVAHVKFDKASWLWATERQAEVEMFDGLFFCERPLLQKQDNR